ncbi:MAG: hypothetical protein IT445_07020 [Phycisphaeraceae bacterium]|nr:hypothetical protein [Phycisphaeraceae bacterium]
MMLLAWAIASAILLVGVGVDPGELPVVSYQDDPTVKDGWDLWRRIRPEWWVPDKNIGRMKVSSAAFTDSSDGSGMSVHLAELVRNSGGDERDVLANYAGCGLASFKASVARKHGQGIYRHPRPEDPSHAEVFGPKPRSVQRALAKECVVLIEPGPPLQTE